MQWVMPFKFILRSSDRHLIVVLSFYQLVIIVVVIVILLLLLLFPFRVVCNGERC